MVEQQNTLPILQLQTLQDTLLVVLLPSILPLLGTPLVQDTHLPLPILLVMQLLATPPVNLPTLLLFKELR